MASFTTKMPFLLKQYLGYSSPLFKLRNHQIKICYNYQNIKQKIKELLATLPNKNYNK
jgi:hypothetical protein